jgi:hypothetical protein
MFPSFKFVTKMDETMAESLLKVIFDQFKPEGDLSTSVKKPNTVEF